MNQYLKEWCDFCEGKKDFDQSHFSQLFHECRTEAELKVIFSYFPVSAALIDKVKLVGCFYPDNFISKSEIDFGLLLNAAVADIQQKRKACVDFGEDELVDIIDNVTPVLVNKSELFEKARNDEWPHGEFLSILTDYFSSKRSSDEKKYYSLFEAFYGFTTSFHIQWYLGSPLIDTDIALDNYIELWKYSCDYALTEKELLVFIKE